MRSTAAKALKVGIETHFLDVDGHIYTDMMFDYEYWHEYVEVFDEVVAIARVGHADQVPKDWLRADGEHVRFQAVYDYLGFWNFLRHLPRVFRDCGRAVAEPGPVLLRMGNISFMCWLHLMLARRPYAFEVVGHAGLGATTVKNVQLLHLGRLIGWVQHRLCRIQASRAACASYVSEYVRSLYPTRCGREWVFSSVKLPDSAYREPRSEQAFDHTRKRIVSVGRVEPEKGHHVLIQAAAEMKRGGFDDFTVDIAGPGSRIEAMRQLAAELGVADHVKLLGFVQPGPNLESLLDRSDLFVLPSLTEGMPRARLEALARGLPAIGSRTGGITEVLPQGSQVSPDDAQTLANVIVSSAGNPERLAAMSRQGVATARAYRHDLMNDRKHAFWRTIVAMAR
ncbi:MAG: glycosyltransferase family 4 protein [Dehalococcoidia bacterium]